MSEAALSIEVAAPAKTKEADVLLILAKQVEGMEFDKAEETIFTLIANKGEDDFKLGGILAVAQEEKWHLKWGYDKFEDCIEQKFSMHYRKALWLIKTYKALIESEVEWSTVKHLGWTRLKEIARIMTKDNADQWISAAGESTVLQLQDMISKSKKAGDGTEPAEKSDLSTLTFKVHPDQKETIESAIMAAQDEMGSAFTSPALEAMALNYLSGEKVGGEPAAKQKTLVEQMQAIGFGPSRHAVEGLFPEDWADFVTGIHVEATDSALVSATPAAPVAVSTGESDVLTFMQEAGLEVALGLIEKLWPEADITVEVSD